MNKIQKKRLYESIMKSVSKTVKRKLNENLEFDTIDKEEFQSIITTLAQEVSRKEELTNIHDELNPGLRDALFGNIVLLGDNGIEYYVSEDSLDLSDFEDVDEIEQAYILYNTDSIEAFDDEYHGRRYGIGKMPKILKKLNPIITKLNCSWNEEFEMIRIYYDGPLNTIDDIKIAIKNLSIIELKIAKLYK